METWLGSDRLLRPHFNHYSKKSLVEIMMRYVLSQAVNTTVRILILHKYDFIFGYGEPQGRKQTKRRGSQRKI